MDEVFDTLYTSTEKMIARIVATNNRDIRKLVSFSMDVEKLYPSLDAKEVTKIVTKEHRHSKLNLKVDNAVLALYL